MSWDWPSFFAGLITGAGLLALVILLLERERSQIAEMAADIARIRDKKDEKKESFLTIEFPVQEDNEFDSSTSPKLKMAADMARALADSLEAL